MLGLVHADDGPLKSLAKDEREQCFPRLLRHDVGTEATLRLTNQRIETSMILTTDSGPMLDCVSYFKQKPLPRLASSLGAIIGSILASFHTTTLPEFIPEILDNNFTYEFILTTIVDPLKERLAHLPNGAALYRRIEEDFTNPNYDYPKVLSHGDMNSSSVLISQTVERPRSPVIIDMEFAQLHGRGVNGDTAQLLANIHCELLAAEHAGKKTIAHTLSRFIQGVCDAYRGTSGLVLCQSPEDEGAQLMRSAFILHGREMISYACNRCKDDVIAGKLIEEGVWYVERAGDDIEAFIEESNWERLGEEHAKVIQSLFKGVKMENSHET